MLIPRSARRAEHQVRAVKRKVTPRPIKRARRPMHPISNAPYSFERSLNTMPQRRSKASAYTHGSCPVRHRTPEPPRGAETAEAGRDCAGEPCRGCTGRWCPALPEGPDAEPDSAPRREAAGQEHQLQQAVGGEEVQQLVNGRGAELIRRALRASQAPVVPPIPGWWTSTAVTEAWKGNRRTSAISPRVFAELEVAQPHISSNVGEELVNQPLRA